MEITIIIRSNLGGISFSYDFLLPFIIFHREFLIAGNMQCITHQYKPTAVFTLGYKCSFILVPLIKWVVYPCVCLFVHPSQHRICSSYKLNSVFKFSQKLLYVMVLFFSFFFFLIQMIFGFLFVIQMDFDISLKTVFFFFFVFF